MKSMMTWIKRIKRVSWYEIPGVCIRERQNILHIYLSHLRTNSNLYSIKLMPAWLSGKLHGYKIYKILEKKQKNHKL